MPKFALLFLLMLVLQAFQWSCTKKTIPNNTSAVNPVVVGAARIDEYLPLLQGKRVALLVNQTSMVGKTHLADTLLSHKVQLKMIFAPEHGFRGEASAGEHVADGKDLKTGLPIVSLYGKKKSPDKSELAQFDILIFDIQDVGARFYTYISTLHYVMEACADANRTLLILDRPNPNGHYVDGPILQKNWKSFIGMHEIPVVHGLTMAEYAKMANEEGWVENKKCDLKYVLCANYDHQKIYELPIRPSPNLPNMLSIYLYPSICFFEGTVFSLGRGTDMPFQVYGHQDFKAGKFSFIPVSMAAAKDPPCKGERCLGRDLRIFSPLQIRNKAQIDLSYLIEAYQNFEDKAHFFLENKFIDKLAGSDTLRKQIIAGWSAEKIKATWQADVKKFKEKRKKYLLYPE